MKTPVFLFFPAAVTIAYLTCLFLIRRSAALGMIDVPNARSSHSRPVPRGGGMGVVAGTAAALPAAFALAGIALPSRDLALLAGFVAAAVLGLFSDRVGIGARIRLAVQTVLAGAIVLVLGGPLAGPAAPVAVLWVAGMTNFYNFMDGIDGLAGCQALVLSLFLVTAGRLTGEPGLVYWGGALSGAAAGFLALNLTPARIFMGDTGSYALGFLAAGIPLAYPPLLVPLLLVMGPFLFDATLTLGRRVLRGERWYEAHRTHFYQRAVSLGYSHLRVTGAVCGISLVFAVLAVAVLRGGVPPVAVAAAEAGVLALAAVFVVRKEKRISGAEQ